MNFWINVFFAFLSVLSSIKEQQRENRAVAERVALKKFERYLPKRIDIEEAEQLALKSIFRDIENAYTNYQVEAMAAAMAKVSNRIDRVQNQLYIDLHWGMEGFFSNYFKSRRGRRRQFGSPAEFECFVKVHTRAALFLGECYCRRNEYNGPLVCLEFETFEVLKEYVDQFRNAGMKDFEESAQVFMEKWIEHIESDQGFIRRCAHWQMDSYEIGIVRGQFSREEAIQWARNAAKPLILRGYTPKWLDEFK